MLFSGKVVNGSINKNFGGDPDHESGFVSRHYYVPWRRYALSNCL